MSSTYRNTVTTRGGILYYYLGGNYRCFLRPFQCLHSDIRVLVNVRLQWGSQHELSNGIYSSNGGPGCLDFEYSNLVLLSDVLWFRVKMFKVCSSYLQPNYSQSGVSCSEHCKYKYFRVSTANNVITILPI